MTIKKIIINKKWNNNKKEVIPPIRLYKLQVMKEYKNNYSIYTIINEKNPLQDKTNAILVKDNEFTTNQNNLNIYPLYIEK